MPPQSNALLLEVRTSTAATGGRDDWDQAAGAEPAGAGVTKWTGRHPVYYRQAVQRTAGGGNVNVVPVRTLYLDSYVAVDAGVDTDDVVVFEDFNGELVEATAQVVARAELAGIPTELQTTRLELAP